MFNSFCCKKRSEDMDSTFCLLFLAFFVSSYSPCFGVLRKHCDIMEHEYFQTYSTRMLWNFGGFDQLNFSLAAVCTLYNTSMTEDLKEVPVASDWLFLDIFNVNITPQALSHLPNLSYIYISGNFVISPVVFHGLEKLSVLWLEQTHNQIIDELDLGGLNMLQELKLRGFPFSYLKKSIFDDLHLLKHLILEDSFIETLSSVTQYLPKLQNLQGLSLYSSNQIAFREADCLLSENPTGNMSPIHFNITYLNIDGHQIYILENNSLCNFPKLSFFKPNICDSALKALKKSGIQEVDSFSFSDSDFSSFHICIYVSLFQIKELQLTHNNIKFIHTSNASCSILKILDLSYNAIKKVSVSQMKKLKNLQELNLSNNEITTINICSENISMELVNLNLTFNYLTSVIQDQFLCLKQLKTLSLSNNKIQKISKYSFRGMKNLEVLHLESNHLYSLDEFAFAGLFSLKQLTLNENVLEEINDWAFEDLRKLEEIAIDVKHLMPMWWSKNMVFLKRMSLKALDDVLSIEPQIFNLLDDLESLSIESQTVFIDMCDEFPFYKVKELSLINIQSIFCSDLEFQTALERFINVEKIYLKANVFVQSEVNLFDSALANLTKLSFFHLENVNEPGGGSVLDIHKLFLGLENLQVLHLVNLRVEDYGSNVLFRDLKSVRFLMIENENIYRFPDNVLSDMVSLEYFFLPNTQFSCQCNLSWLSQWVTYEKQISVPDFYHQLCFVNAEIEHSYLVSFLEENCNTELGFITFIATFVCTLIFMCISLFYESIWWYSLYLLYTIQCWLYNRQRKRERYEYDVFVSYNTHNEQWVTERLLPNLEQNGPPFFKVCIHNRDFEIGRDIVENIVDSIYSSRWTICVITRSYLQSNWCSLEIRMATYRLVAESKDSLILIFLDDIPREELQHYHKLTRIIDKKTYLKWPEDRDGQQLFWARLRKVLAYQDNQKP